MDIICLSVSTVKKKDLGRMDNWLGFLDWALATMADGKMYNHGESADAQSRRTQHVFNATIGEPLHT